MIAFRVEIWCNGCTERLQRGIAHDNHNALPELSLIMIRSAKEAGWTVDGAAHWCPKCTRQKDNEAKRPS